MTGPSNPPPPPPGPPRTGRLMNIDQLAERLGVPRSWVRDAVTAQTIPHTRIGRHVRFTEEHFAAIVTAGETPVADAPRRLATVAQFKGKVRAA